MIRAITLACLIVSALISQGAETSYAPGELLVKYRQNFSKVAQTVSSDIRVNNLRSHAVELDEFCKRYRVKTMAPLIPELSPPILDNTLQSATGKQPEKLRDVYILTIEDHAQDMQRLADEYSKDPHVEYAYPNYVWALAAVPNDPDFSQQWALPILNSENAWDLTTGDSNIVIAVIDTGIDWNHPDLTANIWVNTNEIPGNSWDDDANGYTDDIRGWDFVTVTNPAGFMPGEDLGPPDNDPMDYYGHGTVVAGTAAAAGNNGIGIAGASWHCKIMPLRVGIAERTSGNAYILSSWIVSAIYYATENGADVINLSLLDNNWSPSAPTPTKDAIDFAYEQGVVIVASAGNGGTDAPMYPAAYEKVIGVAATDQDDKRSVWGTPQPPLYQGVSSCYGTWVSVAAPGTDILTTGFDDIYETCNGTSLSAPFVSGLAALIRSIHPEFSNSEVMKVIYSTTDRPDSEKYIGTGRINMANALGMSAVPIAEITSPTHEQVIGADIEVIGSAGGENFASYTLQYAHGFYPNSWSTITSGSQGKTNAILGLWNISALRDNAIHSLRLSVTDTAGNVSISEVVVVIQRSLQTGWPRVLSGNLYPDNLAIGDIDNDGTMEMACVTYRSLGGPNHTHDLFVLHHDGSMAVGWPITNLMKDANGPTLADITQNGDMEVIVSGYTWGYPTSTTKFFVFDKAANLLPGWPQEFISTNAFKASSPSIGDIDNDGDMEIVFTSKNESKSNQAFIFVYNADGSTVPGWPVSFPLQYPSGTGTAQDNATHATLVDLDHDGDLEIIVSISIYQHSRTYVFHHDGTIMSGWPVTLPDGYVVHTVAGDIDNDGDMEMVGSTGNGNIYAWEADATPCSGWPVDIPVAGGATVPSLADLDGDGDLEILVHSKGDQVYAYHHDATLLTGWPVPVTAYVGGGSWPPSIIGDIDGDHELDIIQVSGDEAKIYAWHTDGTSISNWPMVIPHASSIPPVLWDIDGDDQLEMAIAYVDTINVYDMEIDFCEEDLPWPMQWFDMNHSGLYTPLDNTPPTIASVYIADDPTPLQVTFSEPIAADTATNTANYQIDNHINILSATLELNLETVTLATSEHFTNITYTLTVNNLTDRASPPNTNTPDMIYSYIFAGTGGQDHDGDGIPTWWETRYNFAPENPADATEDTDGDGHNNLEEYRAGTDPRNAESIFAIQEEHTTETDLFFSFFGVNGRSYSIENQDSLITGDWTYLSTRHGSNQFITITNTIPTNTSSHFYRVKVTR